MTRLKLLEDALRTIDKLIHPERWERFTKEEVIAHAEKQIENRYSVPSDTVEVCAKCFYAKTDGLGDDYSWLTMDPMSPSSSIYHFAKISGPTASHPNCTHYTPCEAICGEKFTQFVDSGD